MRPSKRDDEELALLGLIGLGVAVEELSLFTSEAIEGEPAPLEWVETDSDDEVSEMRHKEPLQGTKVEEMRRLRS